MCDEYCRNVCYCAWSPHVQEGLGSGNRSDTCLLIRQDSIHDPPAVAMHKESDHPFLVQDILS